MDTTVSEDDQDIGTPQSTSSEEELNKSVKRKRSVAKNRKGSDTTRRQSSAKPMTDASMSHCASSSSGLSRRPNCSLPSTSAMSGPAKLPDEICRFVTEETSSPCDNSKLVAASKFSADSNVENTKHSKMARFTSKCKHVKTASNDHNKERNTETIKVSEGSSLTIHGTSPSTEKIDSTGDTNNENTGNNDNNPFDANANMCSNEGSKFTIPKLNKEKTFKKNCSDVGEPERANHRKWPRCSILGMARRKVDVACSDGKSSQKSRKRSHGYSLYNKVRESLAPGIKRSVDAEPARDREGNFIPGGLQDPHENRIVPLEAMTSPSLELIAAIPTSCTGQDTGNYYSGVMSTSEEEWSNILEFSADEEEELDVPSGELASDRQNNATIFRNPSPVEETNCFPDVMLDDGPGNCALSWVIPHHVREQTGMIRSSADVERNAIPWAVSSPVEVRNAAVPMSVQSSAPWEEINFSEDTMMGSSTIPEDKPSHATLDSASALSYIESDVTEAEDKHSPKHDVACGEPPSAIQNSKLSPQDQQGTGPDAEKHVDVAENYHNRGFARFPQDAGVPADVLARFILETLEIKAARVDNQGESIILLRAAHILNCPGCESNMHSFDTEEKHNSFPIHKVENAPVTCATSAAITESWCQTSPVVTVNKGCQVTRGIYGREYAAKQMKTAGERESIYRRRLTSVKSEGSSDHIQPRRNEKSFADWRIQPITLPVVGNRIEIRDLTRDYLCLDPIPPVIPLANLFSHYDINPDRDPRLFPENQGGCYQQHMYPNHDFGSSHINSTSKMHRKTEQDAILPGITSI